MTTMHRIDDGEGSEEEKNLYQRKEVEIRDSRGL